MANYFQQFLVRDDFLDGAGQKHRYHEAKNRMPFLYLNFEFAPGTPTTINITVVATIAHTSPIIILQITRIAI